MIYDIIDRLEEALAMAEAAAVKAELAEMAMEQFNRKIKDLEAAIERLKTAEDAVANGDEEAVPRLEWERAIFNVTVACLLKAAEKYKRAVEEARAAEQAVLRHTHCPMAFTPGSGSAGQQTPAVEHRAQPRV